MRDTMKLKLTFIERHGREVPLLTDESGREVPCILSLTVECPAADELSTITVKLLVDRDNIRIGGPQ